MNELDLYSGGARYEGAFKRALNSRYVSPVRMEDHMAEPDEYVQGNISESLGMYRRDKDRLARGDYGEDASEWGELSEFGSGRSFAEPFGTSRSRSLGRLYSSDVSFFDDNGKKVDVPELTITNENGEIIQNPSAANIWKYGSTDDVLDRIEFAKKHMENRNPILSNVLDGISMDNLEIESHLYTKWDPEIGWHYQEFVGTKENFEKMKAAGNFVVNKYGAKELDSGGFKSAAKGFANTVFNTPELLGNFFGEAGALISGERGGIADAMEFYNIYSDEQGYFNRSDIAAGTGETFDSMANFGDAIGSGIGSFVQFGGLSKAANIGVKLASSTAKSVGSAAVKGSTKALAKTGAISASKAAQIVGKTGANGLSAKNLMRLENLERMTSMLSAGLVINFEEGYKSGIQNGLSPDEATKLGLATGAVNAVIESAIGPNKFANWMMGSAGSKKAAQAILKAKKIDPSILKDSSKLNGLARKLADVAQKVGDAPIIGTTLEEMSEEFTQSLVNSLGENIYDRFFADEAAQIGEGFFGTNFFSKETFSQALEEGVIGGIVGGLSGGSMFAAGKIKNRNQSAPAEDSSVFSYVARGDGDVYKAGAQYAFDSKAISEEQLAEINTEVDNANRLMRDNKSAFINISGLPKDVQNKATAQTLEVMDRFEKFAEDKSKDKLDRSEQGRDNLNELQSIITELTSQKISREVVLDDGSTDTEEIRFSPTTYEFVKKTLRDNGKLEAESLLNNVLKHTETVNKQIEKEVSNIAKNSKNEYSPFVVFTVAQNMKTAMAESHIGEVFNNKQLEIRQGDVEFLLNFDSENGDNKLNNFHNSLEALIKDKTKDIPEDTDAYYDTIDKQLSDLQKSTKEIAVPGSEEYLTQRRAINELNRTAKSYEVVKNTILDNAHVIEVLDNISSRMKAISTAHSADPDSESAKVAAEKRNEKESPDYLEDKDGDINDIEKSSDDIYNNIVESVIPEGTSDEFNFAEYGDYTYATRKAENGKYVFEKSNGKTGVEAHNKTEFYDTIDDAKKAFDESLKTDISNKLLEEAGNQEESDRKTKDKSILESALTEGSLSETTDVNPNAYIEIATRGEVVSLNLSHRTDNQAGQTEHNETVAFFNRIESNISEIKNNPELRVTPQDKVYFGNKDVKKAYDAFSKIKTLEQWESLKETNPNLVKSIVNLLPMEFSFDGEVGLGRGVSRRYLYLNSSLSYPNGLNAAMFASRETQIRRIIEGGGVFKPSSVSFHRSASFNQNTSKMAKEKRNNKLSQIKGMHIVADEAGNLYHEYSDGVSKGKVKVPVYIGHGTMQGYVSSRTSASSKSAIPGAPYLILPSGMSPSGLAGNVMQLNPVKITKEAADVIYDIMFDIAYGKIGPTTTVKNGDYGISVEDGAKLKYGDLLELLVPNGSYTLDYLDYSGERDFLRTKVLFVDNVNGIVQFGESSKTGHANVFEIGRQVKGKSDSEISALKESLREEFTNWMTENKNFSNSKTTRVKFETSDIPSFSVAGITHKKGQTYDSFVVSNGMTVADINPDTQSIYGRTTLHMEFGGSSQRTEIPASIPLKNSEDTVQKEDKKPSAKKEAPKTKVESKPVQKASNSSSLIDFRQNSVDLAKNILAIESGDSLYLIVSNNANSEDFSIFNMSDAQISAARIDLSDYPDAIAALKTLAKRALDQSGGDSSKLDGISMRSNMNSVIDYHLGVSVNIAGFETTNRAPSNKEESDNSKKDTKSSEKEAVKKAVESDDANVKADEYLGFTEDSKQATDSEATLANAKKLLEELDNEHKADQDNDVSDFLFESEVDAEAVEVSNIKEELKRYRKVLSSLTGGTITMSDQMLQFMGKSGNPRYAWGSMNEDGITLYTASEKGTAFHEAFHRISLLHLTPQERTTMYAEARRVYKLKDASNFEVEEVLAEKFRDYMNNTPVRKSGVLSAIWESIKQFVTQFVMSRRPSYTDLQTLFNTVEKGGYRFVRPSLESVRAFHNRYPSYGALMEYNGVEMPFKSSLSFYNTIGNLTAITLNTNDIDYQVGVSNKDISFEKVKEYLNRILDNERQKLVTAIGKLESAETKDQKDSYSVVLNKIESRVRIQKFLIDNFEKVTVPAIHRKLEKLGLKNKTLTDLYSETDDETFSLKMSETKLFESKESFNYSSKDSASADVKSIFSTITTGEIDPDTGLNKFHPFEEVWFSVLNLVSKADTFQEMMNILLKEGWAQKEAHGDNNIFYQMHDKLTGGKFTESFKTRFWSVAKMHRYNMVNFYFNGNNQMYSINSADTAKRSNALTTMWSTMFGLDKLYSTKSNSKGLQDIAARWSSLKELARSRKIDSNNVEKTFYDTVGLFNMIGIPMDDKVLNTILKKVYYSSGEGEVVSRKENLARRLTNFILNDESMHADGNPMQFDFFFNVVINPTRTDHVSNMLNKDTIIGSKGHILTPEKFLSSNRFVKRIAEAYIETYPALEDDSITGPENSLVYAFSKHNFLTQSVSEYFKDPQYIDNILNSPYSSSSIWANAIKDGKAKPVIETVLGIIEQDNYDKGREFAKISEREDIMLKITAILDGKYIIPTLANKKTYSFISGIPMIDTALEMDHKSGKIKLNDNVVDTFVEYARSEYEAIKQAKRTIEKFLDAHEITAEEFDNMSEREQDNILNKTLKVNYHLQKGKNGTLRLLDKDGKKLDGNGTKFRKFQSFNFISEEELDKMFKSSLSDSIRKILNARVNETITMLSKAGVIELSEPILNSDNSGIGYTKSGQIAVTTESMLSRHHLDSMPSYNSRNEKVSSDVSDKMAILNIATKYAIQSAISVMEFEKTISFDQAYFENVGGMIKRYSALMSTGNISRPDYDNTAELTDIGRDDDSKFRLSDEQLTKYKTITLKSNILSDAKVYDRLRDKYVGTVESPGFLRSKLNSLRNAKDKYGNPKHPKLAKMDDNAFESHLNAVADRTLSKYKAVDQTDAQAYITFDMFRILMITHGDWSDSAEEAYRELSSDKKLSDAQLAKYSGALFANIQKMVYVGPEFEDGLATPIYDKMSLAPIIPRFFKGTDLEAIISEMEKNGIGMAKFDSAVKSGGVPGIRTYNSDQKLSDQVLSDISDARFHRIQEYKYLRHQLNTDPHLEKEVALGVQFLSIGVANIKQDQLYSMNGSEVYGSDVLSRNKSISDAMTDRGQDKFLKSVGAKKENGTFSIDKAKFSEFIYDSISDSQSDNVLNSLGVENNQYKTELSLLPSLSSIQPKILAQMKKDIIDIKMHGGAFIQQSNFGLKSTISGRVSTFGNDDLKLFDEDGKSEVIISMGMIKDYLPKIDTGKASKDGKPKMRNMRYSEAREYVKNSSIDLLGYRIPTQGQNSTLALKIKDILPDINGDTIILPAEFTSLTGADFDIDKLFAISKNLVANTELKTLEYLEYDDDIFENPNALNEDGANIYSNEQLQNALFDTYLATLSSPHNFLETTTPLDATTAPIESIAKNIKKHEASLEGGVGKRQQDQSLYHVFPEFQSKMKSQNMGADAGIGPMALANTNHILTQMSGIELNTDHLFPGGVNYATMLGIDNLSEVYDSDGTLIQDWTSALINAHVDAAKDPYILTLNVNQYTYSALALLVRSGFGGSSFWFLSQPIVKDLASRFNELRGSRLGLTEKERKMSKWKDEVIEKYEELSAEDITEDTGIGGMAYAHEEVVTMLKESNQEYFVNLARTPESDRDWKWYAIQMAIADIYFHVQAYGDAVSNMISYTKVDTGSYGKTASEVAEFQRGLNEMIQDKNGLIKNVGDFVEKTTIGAKKRNSIDMLFDLFGGEVLDMSKSFSDVVMSITDEVGANSFVTDSMIGQISNAVKRSITREFFKDVLMSRSNSEKGTPMNINSIFFGKHAVANRIVALDNFINQSESLRDLKDNLLLNLLVRNATSDKLSDERNMPKMLNAFVNKIHEPDSQDIYAESFRELLTHPNSSIRDFAYELLQYAYFTSGGVAGGLNNFFTLVPIDIYSNLKNSKGETLNEFMRARVAEIHANVNFDQLSHIRRAYQTLWHNDDIVNTVGEFSATRNAEGKIRFVFDTRPHLNESIMYSPNLGKTYYIKGMHAPMSFTLAPRDLKDYTTVGTVGYGDSRLPKYKRFIKFAYNESELPSDYIMYENIGVHVSINPDGTKAYAPIYVYSDKIGFKDQAYQIYETADFSELAINNKFRGERFRPRLNKKLLEDAGTIIYPEYNHIFGIQDNAQIKDTGFSEASAKIIEPTLESSNVTLGQDINQTVPGVTFTKSTRSGYPARTAENASLADITIAIAEDFTTRGEKLTAKMADQYNKPFYRLPFRQIKNTEHVDSFVDMLNKTNSTSINFAGNGMYTLGKLKGASQEKVDNLVYEFLSSVINHPNLKNKNLSVRSGGQTGIDEAGAKAGMRLGLRTIVHAPKDWNFINSDGGKHSNEDEFKSRFILDKTPTTVIDTQSTIPMPSVDSQDISKSPFVTSKGAIFEFNNEEQSSAELENMILNREGYLGNEDFGQAELQEYIKSQHGTFIAGNPNKFNAKALGEISIIRANPNEAISDVFEYRLSTMKDFKVSYIIDSKDTFLKEKLYELGMDYRIVESNLLPESSSSFNTPVLSPNKVIGSYDINAVPDSEIKPLVENAEWSESFQLADVLDYLESGDSMLDAMYFAFTEEGRRNWIEDGNGTPTQLTDFQNRVLKIFNAVGIKLNLLPINMDGILSDLSSYNPGGLFSAAEQSPQYIIDKVKSELGALLDNVPSADSSELRNAINSATSIHELAEIQKKICNIG